MWGATGIEGTALPCLGVELRFATDPGRTRPRVGVEGAPASGRGEPGKELLGGELLVFLGGGSFKSAGVSPTLTTMPGAAWAGGAAGGTAANVGAGGLVGLGAGSEAALVNVAFDVEPTPFPAFTLVAMEVVIPASAPGLAGWDCGAPIVAGGAMFGVFPGAGTFGTGGFADAISDLTHMK